MFSEWDASNLLFLATTVIIITNYWLLSGQWLWCVVLIIVIIRIIKTHNLGLIIISVCFFIITSINCWYQLNQHPTPPHGSLIRVWPDDWQVTSSNVKFKGKTNDGYPVYGVIYCKDYAQRQFYQRLTQPCWLSNKQAYQLMQHATNEAEFDYANYLWQQHHIAYRVKYNAQPSLLFAKQQSLLALIHIFRKQIFLYLQKLPHWSQLHAQSLILGNNDDDFNEYRQSLNKLGIIHLFSLSGLHVFIILQIILKLGNHCRITKETLEIIFLIILPVYVIIAGQSIDIKRAALLAWLQIIIKHWHFACSRLSLWSIVVIINLFWQPYLLFTLGGVLSYLLSLLIIYLRDYSTWQRHLIIYIVSLPILIYFNYQFLTLPIIINFIFAPIFNYFLLPLVYLTGILGPQLAIIAKFSELVLRTNVVILQKIAQFRWTQLPFGSLSLLSLLILISVTCYWLLKRQQLMYRANLLLIITYMVIALCHYYPLNGRVVIFDIGQGDAILLEGLSHRYNVLIDTGGKLAFNQQRATTTRAQTTIVNYLHSRGINKLDAVIVSHQDADHIGDLPVILKLCKVKELVFAEGLLANHNFVRKIKPYLSEIHLRAVLAGDVIQYGKQRLYVILPTQPGIGTNHDSLTIYTVINHQRWLFTGDLDREGELQILQNYPQLRVDFLKVGHHGSRTSSAPAFIHKINRK